MREPIPLRELREAPAGELVRKWGLRRELAEFVSELLPERRSDLLDVPGLADVATPEELILLGTEPRTVPDAPPVARVIRSASRAVKGFDLYRQELETGPARLGIRDAAGEVISAEVAENRPGIRFSSVRLLGYPLGRLLALPTRERERGAARLADLRRTVIGELWRDRELPVPEGAQEIQFRSLSALLNAVLSLTRPRYGNRADTHGGEGFDTGPVAGGGGTGVPDVPSDVTGEDEEEEGECGPGTGFLADLVPELNIAHCCLEHDRCYAEGCTSCDRARCDREFYECMLPVAGPAVAALYYDAVVAFGQFAFNYCEGEGRGGAGGTIAVGVGVAVGVVVGLLAGVKWGIAAGAAAAALTILLNRLFCLACEWVREWECTNWKESRYRRCTERKEKRKKKCAEKKEERKKKCDRWIKLFRWLCRSWTWVVNVVCVAWTYVTYSVCVAWTWVVHKVCVGGRWVLTILTC